MAVVDGVVLNVETVGFERKLTRVEKQQLPFAHVQTLNRTAFETMETTRKGIGFFVDRPTGYTVRSIRYDKATKQRPVSQVFILDDPNKGTAPSEYLNPIVRGGRRGPKPGERQLQRRGMLPRGYGYVPTPALKLNRYGNVPRGKMQQILSGIKGFGQEGYLANRTARSKARKPSRDEYFVVPVGGPAKTAHLTPGVYVRSKTKATNVKTRRSSVVIRPVLLFVPLPVYTAQFDFAGFVRKEAIKRYRRHFRRELARAVASAR